MDIKTLQSIAAGYTNELREYRLTGDLNFLLPVIQGILNVQQNVDINKIRNDFFNALTETEKTAFLAIREQIGFSGNISVVKMIQQTGISRPVWTSLLQKMEKYGMAVIKNQGVKGTYIEFMEEKI